MTEKDYYVPKIKKPKDLSKDLGKYNGVLKDFIDSDSGSIKVKLEHDVIVERVAKQIYTSWESGVRELLTNELKACKLARDNFNANPRIEITIDPIERTLVIQGIDSLGITADTFGNIVSWLGRSHNSDRSSIGMFGMGIEAYTTLSDTLMLESHSRENEDKFKILGRDGKEWTPYNAVVDIPHGCKLTMILNKDLGSGRFFQQLIDRITDVVALHGIPTTIDLKDNVEDEDGISSDLGKITVELLDKEQYMLRLIDREASEHSWRNENVDRSTVHTIHIDRKNYDITLLYALDDAGKEMNTKEWLFTTLIDVPINNEFRDDGGFIGARINELTSMADTLLNSFPTFTAVLINLKDEELYPPVASRDSLIDDWINNDILHDMLDLASEHYNKVRVDNIDDLFDLSSHEVNTWDHIRQYATDRNADSPSIKMLNDMCNIEFAIYKSTKGKHDRVKFKDILSHRHQKINYPNVFYMSSFFKHKIEGIDEQIDQKGTYIRLTDTTQKPLLEKLFKKINKHTNVLYPTIHDSVEWLKSKKIKIKVQRVSKPKGSIVWHYNTLINYNYNESEVNSRLCYDKNRHDSYNMKSIKAKKKTRLQLSNKKYGETKLGIADIVRLLERVPTDIMFCKADSDNNGHSVDDYIKGVMNRKVYTNQGNMILSDLLDSFREDKKEVKLMYYPYPDIINEKAFNYDNHILTIMGKNSDELIGLALCFITDGYLKGVNWDINYDDKHTITYNVYNEKCAEMPSEMRKSLPKKVVSLLDDKRFITRWQSAEHRGCMLLALVDLHRSISAKYFNDMARSLTYTNDYDELSDEVKRIKELCAK